jgi:hypothetical protein
MRFLSPSPSILDEHCKVVSAFLLFLNYNLHINGWVLKVIPPA